MHRLSLLFAAVASLVLTLPNPARGDDPHRELRPHAGMLRSPDVSATHIAFRYADDLWLIPREGGVATPLASPPGPEERPRFSPDGTTLAFMANYDGGRDLYTLPVAGGLPFRVTHRPFSETLCDWTSDGRLLFYMSSSRGLGAETELYTVDARGGLPQRVPISFGAEAALSAEGRRLVFTPRSTSYYRAWKRYVGGTAADLWLFDLQTRDSRLLTDWPGTDTYPMWSGDRIYYLSNAGPNHRENIWVYDTVNGGHRQVTRFDRFDVKWPAIGPKEYGPGQHAGADRDQTPGTIVFVHGSNLFLLDLATEQARAVEVKIPGARPRLRPQPVDVADFITSVSLSPTGKRIAVEARGDIWTLPAKDGTPRNLSRSSGVAERGPVWSPNRRWIAYFSDADGEIQLYVRQSDGRGGERRLTSGKATFFSDAVWSPDSQHIAFCEKTGDIWLYSFEADLLRHVGKDPWVQERQRISWSPDSRWIAFDQAEEAAGEIRSVWLYSLDTGQATRVTSEFYDDREPVFDRQGDFLFFSSRRSLEPTFGDLQFAFVYQDTSVLVAVPLNREVELPYLPKSNEETWTNGDGTAEGETGEHNGEPGRSFVKIDLENFESRAVLLPVAPGAFHGLSVNDEGQLVYLRQSQRAGAAVSSVRLFDLDDDDKEEKTVVAEAVSFSLSADGSKLVARQGDAYSIYDAKPGAEGTLVKTNGMLAMIDPRQEWKQVFLDTWRLYRDFFYEPDMHGLDWSALRDRYLPLLDDCSSRADLTSVINEMLSELNVGHAGLRGGAPAEEQPRRAVGMLGADFVLDDGAYRLARLYEGAPWHLEDRNPLRQVGVREGEYLLAVDGIPVDTSKDVWAAFIGLAGRPVAVTVGPRPRLDGDARQVVVEPGNGRWEMGLRYRHTIEAKRRQVDEATDGRVGYLHIPDYSQRGLDALVEQFLPQRGKEALVIDQRWNGGGFTPHRFLEILNRPPIMVRARRDGRDRPVPDHAHFGPKCLLMNELSGSSGDMFPWMFRQAGLGPLVGTRTWGGVVGLSGNPSLIDGERLLVPNNGTYDPQGGWIIEGHGVEPDLEIVHRPEDRGDPQLDAAIRLMLEALEESPYVAPRRPAPPRRQGIGVPDGEW